MSPFGFASPMPVNTKNNISNYYQENNRVRLSDLNILG